MLFFYWMSSKGGAKTVYDLIITRIFRGNLPNLTKSSTQSEDNSCGLVSESVVITKNMLEEELDDSILESVQESENDECTISDQESNNEDDSKSVDDTLQSSINNADYTTFNEVGFDGIKSVGLKTFKTGLHLNVPTITITAPFDHAPEAAE